MGDELLPFHPDASHVHPEYRDGWNACYLAVAADRGGVSDDDVIEAALGTGNASRWDVWAAFSRAQALIEAIAQGGCDHPQVAAHSASAELREVRTALSGTSIGGPRFPDQERL